MSFIKRLLSSTLVHRLRCALQGSSEDALRAAPAARAPTIRAEDCFDWQAVANNLKTAIPLMAHLVSQRTVSPPVPIDISEVSSVDMREEPHPLAYGSLLSLAEAEAGVLIRPPAGLRWAEHIEMLMTDGGRLNGMDRLSLNAWGAGISVYAAAGAKWFAAAQRASSLTGEPYALNGPVRVSTLDPAIARDVLSRYVVHDMDASRLSPSLVEALHKVGAQVLPVKAPVYHAFTGAVAVDDGAHRRVWVVLDKTHPLTPSLDAEFVAQGSPGLNALLQDDLQSQERMLGHYPWATAETDEQSDDSVSVMRFA